MKHILNLFKYVYLDICMIMHDISNLVTFVCGDVNSYGIS